MLNSSNLQRTPLPVIDIHVHFGAPHDEESGCYWSKKFTQTAAYYAMLLMARSLFKKINISQIRKQLLNMIDGSKYVDQCVLLALDQVYDSQGNLHQEWTHLYVPNRYLAALAAENNHILFGASVHPYRKDWSDELETCLAQKAVLCKWIPSSQQIDPSHPSCVPFYKKLADIQLPLLCHVGPEYTIPTSDNLYHEFNNPKYLRVALDLGVTVILAHCGMPYFGWLDEDYQDDFREFLRLFEESEKNDWQLYADLSAICSPLRTQYLKIIKERLEKIPVTRLLFGSDYPVPLSEFSFHQSPHFFSWLRHVLRVALMKNYLDKNYLLIKEMQFGDSVFTNAATLFKQIHYSGE